MTTMVRKSAAEILSADAEQYRNETQLGYQIPRDELIGLIFAEITVGGDRPPCLNDPPGDFFILQEGVTMLLCPRCERVKHTSRAYTATFTSASRDGFVARFFESSSVKIGKYPVSVDHDGNGFINVAWFNGAGSVEIQPDSLEDAAELVERMRSYGRIGCNTATALVMKSSCVLPKWPGSD